MYHMDVIFACRSLVLKRGSCDPPTACVTVKDRHAAAWMRPGLTFGVSQSEYKRYDDVCSITVRILAVIRICQGVRRGAIIKGASTVIAVVIAVARVSMAVAAPPAVVEISS